MSLVKIPQSRIADLSKSFESKQDKLTAGKNINIEASVVGSLTKNWYENSTKMETVPSTITMPTTTSSSNVYQPYYGQSVLAGSDLNIEFDFTWSGDISASYILLSIGDSSNSFIIRLDRSASSYTYSLAGSNSNSVTTISSSGNLTNGTERKHFQFTWTKDTKAWTLKISSAQNSTLIDSFSGTSSADLVYDNNEVTLTLGNSNSSSSALAVVYTDTFVISTSTETKTVISSPDATWGSIQGTLSDQEDLQEAFDLKQDKYDESLTTNSKYVVGAINELYADKAFITDLSHVPAGLTHTIDGKNLVIAPGHVLNYTGNTVLVTTKNTTQAIGTVTQGLQSGIILGDTAERTDILDYTTLSSEFSSQGRIIPVDALGGYDGFASGTVNSAGTGFDDAVAMFYEGTTTSKSTGFLFDTAKDLGEYVVTLAADENITDARIAFYTLKSTTEKDDGTYDYEFELVSQSIVSATSPNTKVSLTGVVSSSWQMIAISVNIDYARYCRLYKVSVAATYNTFLCKYGQGWVIRMALSEQALIDANYTNFAKVGQVTIGDGPVACYPEKDISSAYADGDLKQQEPSYSNFYTRKEMDALISELDRTKADKGDTLSDYGITNAYTILTVDSLLNKKQDTLTAGTNIKIENNVISTTFDETYSKADVDSLLSTLDEAKADKATSLEGYGITDAYTKVEVNTLTNAKQDANDEKLTTEAKSIVPAINEVNAIAISPLGEIVTSLPETGDDKKVYFVLNSASESTIDKYNEYIYVDGAWELIGGGSSAGSGAAKADNITIVSNVDESITTIGVKTKSDVIKYDWVGTMEEWEAGRADGTILDDWFCYITDDGTPVVNASDAKTYATIEYVTTSISEAVDPVQTELTTYKSDTNTTISTLQSDTTALEARVTVLETAFGETVDQINGEVI